MDAKPPTLSGGEKQRVALARSLVSKPDLILADEPTGNVDPAMSERIMKLFVELNKLGASVIVATHDLHLVHFVASLPFTFLGENVGQAGKTLVAEPAKATFVRCLGCKK